MESRSDADGPWCVLRSRLGAATDPRACLESLMADGWFDDHLGVVAEMPSVSAGPEQYHGEGDLWTHTLLVVEEMHALRPHDTRALLMALVHDIGKVRTAEAADHRNHDDRGAELIAELVAESDLPAGDRAAMRDACAQHMRLHNLPIGAENALRPAKVLRVVDGRRDEAGASLSALVDLLEADSRGREPPRSFPRTAVEERLGDARAVVDAVDRHAVAAARGSDPDEYSDRALAQMIEADRVERLSARDARRRE